MQGGSPGRAKEYSEREIDPKQPFYAADFKGAKFTWTDDLLLDNTVLFRRTIPSPPDGRQRADFTNLNNTVPNGPPKPGGKRPREIGHQQTGLLAIALLEAARNDFTRHPTSPPFSGRFPN